MIIVIELDFFNYAVSSSALFSHLRIGGDLLTHTSLMIINFALSLDPEIHCEEIVGGDGTDGGEGSVHEDQQVNVVEVAEADQEQSAIPADGFVLGGKGGGRFISAALREESEEDGWPLLCQPIPESRNLCTR